jgi:hypothetical protein
MLIGAIRFECQVHTLQTLVKCVDLTPVFFLCGQWGNVKTIDLSLILSVANDLHNLRVAISHAQNLTRLFRVRFM